MAQKKLPSSPASSGATPPMSGSGGELGDQVLNLVVRGESQTSIAKKLGKSDPWVSGQVSHHKQRLGKYDFEAVKSLAKQMRDAQATPLDCFEALPLINTLRNIGANKDNLKEFLTDFCHHAFAKNQGLEPEKFADTILEVLSLSEQINTPLVRLPEYLVDATKQKEDLERAIGVLYDKKNRAKSELEAALANAQATPRDLEQFVYVRKALRRHAELFSPEATDADIVSEVNKLATMLNNARAAGYNSSEIVARASTIESLDKEYKRLLKDVDSLERRSAELDRLIKENSIIIDAYKKLQSMQFGIGELTTLYNLLKEVAREKNLPVHEIKARLFKNLAKQYLNALNFELTLENLKRELTINTEKLNELELNYANKKHVIDALDAILARGVKDQDILAWHGILQKYNNVGINIKSLATDVEAYGTLKASLEKLNGQEVELREYIDALWLDIDALEGEKKQVEFQVNALATKANEALMNLSERAHQLITNTTLQSTADIKSASSDMKAIVDSLKEEYGKITELGGFGEFEPLIRAARGDRTINFHDLKGSVIRAMELMIPRVSQLDTRTSEDLRRARQTLRSAIPDLSAE